MNEPSNHPHTLGIGVENISHVIGAVQVKANHIFDPQRPDYSALEVVPESTPTCHTCAAKVQNHVVDATGAPVDLVIQLIAKDSNSATVACSNGNANPSTGGTLFALDDNATKVEVNCSTTSGGPFSHVGDIDNLVHRCNTIGVNAAGTITNSYWLVTCSTGTIYIENQSRRTVYLYDSTTATTPLVSAPAGQTTPCSADSGWSGAATQTLYLSTKSNGVGQSYQAITLGHSHQATVEIHDYSTTGICYPMVATPASGATSINVKNVTGHDCNSSPPQCVEVKVPGQTTWVAIDDGASQSFDLTDSNGDWVLHWDDSGDPKVVGKKVDCSG